jgi:hypothetical protein
LRFKELVKTKRVAYPIPGKLHANTRIDKEMEKP